MITGAGGPVSIVNGLLSLREKGEEFLKEFIEKRLTSREKGFYEPIKWSGIQVTIEKKKQERYLFWKKDRQALGLLVANYPDKKEAFNYPLNVTLCKPRTKYLFRNYLTDTSISFFEIPSELNPVVIYDAMAVIRFVPSKPAWEDLFKILIKVHKLKETTEIIIVFENCTDELESLKK